MSKFQRSITLAMTGASGAQYGLRLLECIIQKGLKVQFLISDAARIVVAFLTLNFDAEPGQIVVSTSRDWFSSVASGSAAPQSMVICPASGGTISAIASGASNNLIERAADVAIKERYQLVVVPRETPLSEIHLENMLKLARLGVTILPASPGFYHDPEKISDLIDFIVARVLDHLDISQDIVPRWGDDTGNLKH